MKKFLTVYLMILVAGQLSAQNYFNLNNCASINSYLITSGDTVVISCDSAYLLNKRTFSLYQLAYQRLKGNDVSTRQVFNTYESLVQLQERRISQQDLEYTKLKAQFDSLAFSSNRFIGSTGTKLDEIKTELSNANGNLKAAMDQLDEAQASLQKERQKKFKNAITWGLGGFTIGLVTCLLLK